MLKSAFLLTLLLFVNNDLLKGQKFEFQEAQIKYSFEDTTYNYETVVGGTLGLFDSEKGVLIFGFPLEAIIRVSNSIGVNHNLDLETMLQHQGLFWGDYDIDLNGNYEGNTRGLLAIQGEEVSRGFASETVISIENGLNFIRTDLKFELGSVPGLEVFENEESFLSKEIQISIKVTQFGNSN